MDRARETRIAFKRLKTCETIWPETEREREAKISHHGPANHVKHHRAEQNGGDG